MKYLKYFILLICCVNLFSQDINRDGIVNTADFDSIKQALGTSASDLKDIDGSNLVDGPDYFIVSQRYGDTLLVTMPDDDSLRIILNQTHDRIGDDFSDIVFWWIIENDTLFVYTDSLNYSAGDSIATLASSATINTDAARVGTYGLDIPGSYDYAQFLVSADGDIFPGQFRIGMWYYGNAHAFNQHIFTYHFAEMEPWSKEAKMSVQADSCLSVFINQGDGKYSANSTSTKLNTGQWYFLEMAYDTLNKAVRIYIDGALDTTFTSPYFNESILYDAADIELEFGQDLGTTADFYLDNIIISSNPKRNLYPLAYYSYAYPVFDGGYGIQLEVDTTQWQNYNSGTVIYSGSAVAKDTTILHTADTAFVSLFSWQDLYTYDGWDKGLHKFLRTYIYKALSDTASSKDNLDGAYFIITQNDSGVYTGADSSFYVPYPSDSVQIVGGEYVYWEIYGDLIGSMDPYIDTIWIASNLVVSGSKEGWNSWIPYTAKPVYYPGFVLDDFSDWETLDTTGRRFNNRTMFGDSAFDGTAPTGVRSGYTTYQRPEYKIKGQSGYAPWADSITTYGSLLRFPQSTGTAGDEGYIEIDVEHDTLFYFALKFRQSGTTSGSWTINFLDKDVDRNSATNDYSVDAWYCGFNQSSFWMRRLVNETTYTYYTYAHTADTDWHTLEVDLNGTHIRSWLDGNWMGSCSISDSTFGTGDQNVWKTGTYFSIANDLQTVELQIDSLVIYPK